MGQKVNPVGFRLGTSRDHDSIWFAKSKDYSKLVMEDIKVRERIKEILPQAPISSVIIKRTMEEVIVDINTSRYPFADYRISIVHEKDKIKYDEFFGIFLA